MNRFITNKWFDTWKSMLDVDTSNAFMELQKMELEPQSFAFYTSVSVVSSSKIEGEQMEIDSFVKYKLLNVGYLPELTEKPNDLYNAYLFANESGLNTSTFHKAHELITAHLLPKEQQGVLRKTEMLVLEHQSGKIQYEATPLEKLDSEYSIFWNDVNELIKVNLSIDEVFYYAAFIHLVFVAIHPFADGNGRIGRLLEKWFLAEKLGERAWFIQSERYYFRNVTIYYRNLARVGMFYDQLDFQKSIPFLLMLPKALQD